MKIMMNSMISWSSRYCAGALCYCKGGRVEFLMEKMNSSVDAVREGSISGGHTSFIILA